MKEVFYHFQRKFLGTGRPHLHSAVEEAAVLARLIQQSFGGGQRQHAPRLV